MNCRDAELLLSAHLDAELESTSADDLAAHLDACAPCAERFRLEQRADALMRSKLSDGRMPALQWNLLRQRIGGGATRRWRLPLVVATAAAFLLLAVVPYFWADSPASATALASDFYFEQTQPGFDTVAEGPEAFDATVRETLGGSLHWCRNAARASKHRIEFIRVSRQSDGPSSNYLVVWAKCCGRPVVIVLSRAEDGGWPVKLRTLVSQTPCGSVVCCKDDVRVSVREIGTLRVAALGKHDPCAVLDELARQSQ